VSRSTDPATYTKVGERYFCSFPGCSKSFGRISDNRRHVQTVHCQTNVYCCPVQDCCRSNRPFSRKDKRNEHVRKVHKLAPPEPSPGIIAHAVTATEARQGHQFRKAASGSEHASSSHTSVSGGATHSGKTPNCLAIHLS
jgi:hypothetical protein